MSVLFNPARGPVLITAELHGPLGRSFAQLALDTGATTTLINVGKLTSLGYRPSASKIRRRVTMAGGVAHPPQVSIDRIDALGQHRRNLLVIAHTLPSTAGVDGLLGLDFLRGFHLTIDFRKGEITLV